MAIVLRFRISTAETRADNPYRIHCWLTLRHWRFAHGQGPSHAANDEEVACKKLWYGAPHEGEDEEKLIEKNTDQQKASITWCDHFSEILANIWPKNAKIITSHDWLERLKQVLLAPHMGSAIGLTPPFMWRAASPLQVESQAIQSSHPWCDVVFFGQKNAQKLQLSEGSSQRGCGGALVSAGIIHHVIWSFPAKLRKKMPKFITSHDVLEPLKQALLAPRDVIISGQICGSKLQRVFTLGDVCWLPNRRLRERMDQQVSLTTALRTFGLIADHTYDSPTRKQAYPSEWRFWKTELTSTVCILGAL